MRPLIPHTLPSTLSLPLSLPLSLWFLLLPSSLFGQLGSSCSNAFALTEANVISVTKGEYWFEAQSFDLPYTVYFSPDNPEDIAPKVYADMSCPHGYSPDPTVQKLLNNSWKTLFPRRLNIDTLFTEDGHPIYKCYYGREKLKLLSAYGIDYSVPVYIHLIIDGSGQGEVGEHEKGMDCHYTATTLHSDSITQLAAHDTIFRLKQGELQDVEIARFTWQSTDTIFPRAYFTGVCDSILDDAILLDSMDFYWDEDSTHIVLDIPHVTIASWLKQDADGDLFIRLNPRVEGTLRWGEYKFIPTCNNQSILFLDTDTIFHQAKSIQEIYKINADRWQYSAHLFEWQGTDMVRLFMADTCTFPLVRTNRHVGYCHEILPGDSVIIPSKTMQSICKNYIDSYENVYIKIRSNGSGQLITRVVPDPPEPIPTAVIELKPAAQPRQLIFENGQIYILVNGHRYNLLGFKIN